jgi:hypothetical protein|nr:hypothetical protein [Kofleriaceae bacterium]
MADFRAFLAPSEPVVLPYFGGTRIDAADRRYRVDDDCELGWWRWRITGRRAEPLDRAAAPDLAALPAVRGHWADGWLASSGSELARVAMPPDDEPPPLARATARRWHSGDLVFDSVDFEDDAEVAARDLLEQRRALGQVRGAVPSLRVAFAIALGGAVARELGTPVSPRELVPRALAIADGGPDAVRGWLGELAAQRQRAIEEAQRRAETIRLRSTAGTARVMARANTAHERVDEALDSARARLLSVRRLQRGTQLDVTWEVSGTRLLTLVDADTLQVLDPGVCIYDHELLTLDAMPSVVREAIEAGTLNILRHA